MTRFPRVSRSLYRGRLWRSRSGAHRPLPPGAASPAPAAAPPPDPFRRSRSARAGPRGPGTEPAPNRFPLRTPPAARSVPFSPSPTSSTVLPAEALTAARPGRPWPYKGGRGKAVRAPAAPGKRWAGCGAGQGSGGGGGGGLGCPWRRGGGVRPSPSPLCASASCTARGWGFGVAWEQQGAAGGACIPLCPRGRLQRPEHRLHAAPCCCSPPKETQLPAWFFRCCVPPRGAQAQGCSAQIAPNSLVNSFFLPPRK